MHGQIPEDADVTYFDYEKCIDTYMKMPTANKNDDKLQKMASEIADSCMMTELRVRRVMEGENVVLYVDPQKYARILTAIGERLNTTNVDGRFSTTLARTLVTERLGNVASDHGYVLKIVE